MRRKIWERSAEPPELRAALPGRGEAVRNLRLR
jgi:hypothetical protein